MQCVRFIEATKERMRWKPGKSKPSAAAVAKDFHHHKRKHHSAEGKIRNVPETLRLADSISELCQRKRIATSLN